MADWIPRNPIKRGCTLTLAYILLSLPAFAGVVNQKILSQTAAGVFADEIISLSLYDITVDIQNDSGVNTNSGHYQNYIRTNPLYQGFSELLIIDNISFDQDTILHSGPYQTTLIVMGNYFEIRTGKCLGAFEFNVKGSGKSTQQSTQNAWEQLRHDIRLELKAVYWYSSEIMGIQNEILEIQGGGRQGITPHMMFDIIHPDPEETGIRNRDTPFGTRIGLAQVTDTSSATSRLKIRRLWGPIHSECRVIERLHAVSAWQYGMSVSSLSKNLYCAFQARPYAFWDWGFNLHFLNLLDSRGTSAYGFGFSGIGAIRFVQLKQVSFSLNVALDSDILFEKDDNQQVVATIIFSTPVGVTAEWQLSGRQDLIFGAGFRFGTESSEWDYTDDDVSMPAYWERRTPSVENSGLFITAGIRQWID